jgi:malate synthase
MIAVAHKRKDRVEVLGPVTEEMADVLTDDALAFVADLARAFGPRVEALLERRQQIQARLDQGERLGFLPETQNIRDADWKVADLPAELLDRRVEITGPVDRKMIINALNSGAQVFMADLEDSNAPSWDNVVLGQKWLSQAVRGTLAFEDTARGKSYALNDEIATLMVRPRGWHLVEAHMRVDGRLVPAALFDFGLFLFHNADALLERGKRPLFYLPKLEGHLEARLWNAVFVHAQTALGLPVGTIRATVLLETLPAAFEMDEILYELRDHSAGLNCGRWDYIFSFIKVHRADPAYVLPDRAQVGMTQPFLRAYTQLVIKTCHRRGACAMGGMAAQIPIKSDPEANEAALTKVREDKQREAKDGHDGTWVAHPGLVSIAREAFDAVLKGKTNQLDVSRDDFGCTANALLALPSGQRTEAGLRQNCRVGVLYLESWLGGNGCVPIDNLMEDAATAEISRTQLWQQVHHLALLDDDRIIDLALVIHILDEELARIERELGEQRFTEGHFEQARELFLELIASEKLPDFLTPGAYALLQENDR